MLDRGIPHIDGSWALHRRTNSWIHGVQGATQRNRAIGANSREWSERRRIGNTQLSQQRLIRSIKCINREVVTDGSGTHVLRVYILVNKNGEVLRHRVAKVRPEYSDVEAAPVAKTYYSLRPQLIRDAQSRPECAEIVSNVAIQSERAKAAHSDDALIDVC